MKFVVLLSKSAYATDPPGLCPAHRQASRLGLKYHTTHFGTHRVLIQYLPDRAWPHSIESRGVFQEAILVSLNRAPQNEDQMNYRDGPCANQAKGSSRTLLSVADGTLHNSKAATMPCENQVPCMQTRPTAYSRHVENLSASNRTIQ